MVIGAILIIGALLGSKQALKLRERSAIKQDARLAAREELNLPYCPGLDHKISLPSRVMKETETSLLVVDLKNENEYESCPVVITLQNSSFEMSPTDDTRRLSLGPSEARSINWILTPKKTGKFDITVFVNRDGLKMNITVTNVVGLTAFEAYFLTGLGLILGSMLTIPYWVEKLGPKLGFPKKQRKKRK